NCPANCGHAFCKTCGPATAMSTPSSCSVTSRVWRTPAAMSERPSCRRSPGMRRGVLVLLALLTVVRPATAQMAAAELERTVDQALEFLKTQQEADGSWGTGRGAGRHPALTGLAVMAYLSAGHLPGEGPYRDTVERGVRWGLGAQRP